MGLQQLFDQRPHGAGSIVPVMHLPQNQRSLEEHRIAVRKAFRIPRAGRLGEITHPVPVGSPVGRRLDFLGKVKESVARSRERTWPRSRTSVIRCQLISTSRRATLWIRRSIPHDREHRAFLAFSGLGGLPPRSAARRQSIDRRSRCERRETGHRLPWLGHHHEDGAAERRANEKKRNPGHARRQRR